MPHSIRTHDRIGGKNQPLTTKSLDSTRGIFSEKAKLENYSQRDRKCTIRVWEKRKKQGKESKAEREFRTYVHTDIYKKTKDRDRQWKKLLVKNQDNAVDLRKYLLMIYTRVRKFENAHGNRYGRGRGGGENNEDALDLNIQRVVYSTLLNSRTTLSLRFKRSKLELRARSRLPIVISCRAVLFYIVIAGPIV